MELYEILGCEVSATKQELKKAYYKLAQKYHPDHGGDEEMFKKIADAYSILSDEAKKKLYDEEGIILNESESQAGKWVRDTFAQMVEVWIKAKLTDQPVSTFPKYVEGRIKENKNEALEKIKDLKNKKIALKKYEQFAKVSEGENIFVVAIRRISDEIEQGMREHHTLVYKSDMLMKEFKRYEFDNMEDDEAMQFISMFGTGPAHTMSDTIKFRTPWGFHRG